LQVEEDLSEKDEILKILTELGLTLLQAKIYIAFSKLENASIKVIAKTAGVARQDVYRLMPTLEELGLAERLVTDPVTYLAAPMFEGIDSLLRQRETNYSELKRKSSQLLLKFGQKFQNKCEIAIGEKIIVISEKTTLQKTFVRDFQNAKISSSFIAPWNEYRNFLVDETSNGSIRKNLNKGVKIRIITEAHGQQDGPIAKIEKTLRANPLFEARYISTPTPIYMTLDDKKIVTIRLRGPSAKGESILWTDNPKIALLASTYFETLWRKTKRINRRFQANPMPLLSQ
jgi:sugar-specific transcriptional regulator TrmB